MGISNLAAFLFQAILISLSGVMAPGPMSAVTVGEGSKSPHAGAFMAFGHGIVEIPLMLVIFYGLSGLIEGPVIRTVLQFLGAGMLLYMGFGFLASIKPGSGNAVGPTAPTRSPMVAGIVLSAGNPYFLIWWITIGGALTVQAFEFGLVGMAAFAAIHWLCDFIWLYFLSASSHMGGKLIGTRYHKFVPLVSGIALLFFGAKFAFDGFLILTGGKAGV